jgi:hypothetical protein
VLRFPDQHLDLGALKRFSEQFGEIQGRRPAGETRLRNTRRSTSSPTSRRVADTSAAGRRAGLAHRHDPIARCRGS